MSETKLERELDASVSYAAERNRQERGIPRLEMVPVEPRHIEAVAQGPVFTQEQESMIRDTFLNGATKQEAIVLLEVARARKLNPFLRQIHFVKRWDTQKGANVWSAQVSIDGLRAIAERTGKYDGQDEPEYGPVNERGYPQWAKVRIYRKDWSRPAVGMVFWEEYVQTKKDGSVSRFWDSMPRVMMAKCAESVAMRKAFPEDMSGLYTAEELGQSENDRQQLPIEQQPPRINPHGVDEDEAPPPDADAFDSLLERLTIIENAVPLCRDYSGALALRDLLGSKAKQSRLTKDIQSATERGDLSPSQRQVLGKTWQRLDRQATKLEAQFKPDLLESFHDEPDEPSPSGLP